MPRIIDECNAMWAVLDEVVEEHKQTRQEKRAGKKYVHLLWLWVVGRWFRVVGCELWAVGCGSFWFFFLQFWNHLGSILVGFSALGYPLGLSSLIYQAILADTSDFGSILGGSGLHFGAILGSKWMEKGLIFDIVLGTGFGCHS